VFYGIEYSHADGPEHTIVFSILTDLTSKETTENEKSMNQSESNSNDASTSARAKLLTD
jgi:hypothetical protein